MKSTKKPLIAGGVAAVVAGGAFFYLGTELPGSAQAATQSQLIEQAQLTEAEAQKIALGEVAGDVTEAEVEEENGVVFFEFEIQTDTGETEVEVNGETGEIAGTENEDDDESEATKEQLIEQAQLTEAEAQEIALGVVTGDVTEVEVEEENGVVVLTFDITTDAGIMEVEVDGDTGEVLAAEAADDGNENDND